MIAPGAESIIKERLRGFRPADVVVVSLVGRTSFANPTVLPADNRHYDWRWVVGLDVVLCISRKTAWRELATAIKLAGPEHLRLWSVDSQRGAEVFWRPVFPVNEAPEGVVMVADSGWYFDIDFSPFHEEDNKAFAQ